MRTLARSDRNDRIGPAMIHDRRAVILDKLSLADQAYLRRFPLHQWRIGAPSAPVYAVASAAAVIAPGMAAGPASRVLARELARYAAATWRHHCHLAEPPPGMSPATAALWRVLKLRDVPDAPSISTIWRALRKVGDYECRITSESEMPGVVGSCP